MTQSYKPFCAPKFKLSRGRLGKPRKCNPKTVAFFAVLTFALTNVMMADLYSPGPNTTDLQGQWIDATTTPQGGPPVYGTPGPADDVDLQGFDITASGGSVRSIFDSGSLTVSGIVSAVEASAFTLRGSGTLNVTGVSSDFGLFVDGGHLKASGPADNLTVSNGGVVTASSCKRSAFSGRSSLTIKGTGFSGSTASFFSGSSLTAMDGLRNFSFTLSSGSLAHVLNYRLENGFVSIKDPGSAFTVDQNCELDGGLNFSITSGGNASVGGNLITDSSSVVGIDGTGSKLTVTQDLVMMKGDLQISNGGNGIVTGEFQMHHGHIGIRDSGSVLTVPGSLSIGGDGSPAAIVDFDNQGAILDGGAEIDILTDGVINVRDGRSLTGRGDFNLDVDNLVVEGGTLNIDMGGRVFVTRLFVLSTVTNESEDPPVTATISGGELRADSVNIRSNTLLEVKDGGRVTLEGQGSLFVVGSVSVSGAGSLLDYVRGSLVGDATLHANDKGVIRILVELQIPTGGGVTTAGGGSVTIGSTASAEDEFRVGPGGQLLDNGAVTCKLATILPGGSAYGTGTINGKLVNSGEIFPGKSPGIFHVQGDYTQNSDGLLGIEIGGSNAGTGYDQLQVSGTATIAGTLQVRLMNGFTPTVGQTYRIVTAGSFSGGFSSITQPSQAGISVSNDGGGVTVTITSVVAGAPVISSATTVAAAQGQAFSYQITATNNPTSFGAMNLPDGLTVNQTSGLISGTPTKAGTYVVPMAANNDAGSGQADLIIQVGLPAITTPSKLLNISTRMRVLAGDNVLIGGFIVTGTEPKKVIIRGIGPSLSAAGLTGALADPTLELHQPDGAVITNDNWKINAQTGQSQEADIRATTIPPTDDLESAIVATLPPGNYSAVLAGKNQSSGIGVVEVYDLAQTAKSQLANISSRGFIDTGDNAMIGGFIVGGGTGNANVIVRALGPSIPVTGALSDPTLELHDASGTILTSNDNWKTRPDGSSQRAEIEATTIPPSNDLDSALVATLPPGNYTAVVRGKNNTTGIGLVEVYKLQ
jgi:hypothetical protein